MVNIVQSRDHGLNIQGNQSRSRRSESDQSRKKDFFVILGTTESGLWTLIMDRSGQSNSVVNKSNLEILLTSPSPKSKPKVK